LNYTPPSPFCSGYFWDGVSNYLPGLTLNFSPPNFSLPNKITDVSHWRQLHNSLVLSLLSSYQVTKVFKNAAEFIYLPFPQLLLKLPYITVAQWSKPGN
jgi:hypothetical protein